MPPLLFRSGKPIRRPYPYDIVLSNVGMMLGKESEESASLVSARSRDLTTVAPTDYRYSSQSPEIERTQAYDDLVLGYGLGTQQSFEDRRYNYAILADLSIQGLYQKGPNITTVTPDTVDSTKGIIKFFEIGGSLYALNGRYALKRTADTGAGWGVSKDFDDYGTGTTGLDVEMFHSAAITSRAFVALDNSEDAAHFDGTNWAQATGITALAFKAVGREFYRAHTTNQLTKVDSNADPTDTANWAAYNAFRAGDRASSVTRLAVDANGALIIFKTDGVYTLDPDTGQDTELFPQLKVAPNADNGKANGMFLNDLYFNYGHGFYRMSPDGTRTEVGPETVVTTDAAIQGPVTAFASHDTFHAYAAIHDIDADDSYLMKYGAWAVQDGQPQRLLVWHGSISAKYTGKHITTLYKTTIGAPSNHHRLYIGFDDGTIGYMVLPCQSNPSACSQYAFSTTNGEVNLPKWNGMFAADSKTLRSATVNGLNLDSTDYVQLNFRLDPSVSSFTDFANNFDSVPFERADFPDNTQSYLAELRVILVSDATTKSPLVTNVALHHAIRPALVLVHTFFVLAEDGLVRRDNTPLRIGRVRIRDVIRNAADATGDSPLILPDETDTNVSLIGYQEVMAWDERLKKWRAAIKVEAAENRSSTIWGTWARAETYTWGGLEALGSWGRAEKV